MDAVVLFNSHKLTGKKVINGSIINAFEYYIAINKFTDSRPAFLLVDFDEEYMEWLIQLFENRYKNLRSQWDFGFIRMDYLAYVDLTSALSTILMVDHGTHNNLMPVSMEAKKRIVISESLNEYKPRRGEPYPDTLYLAEMDFDWGEPYRMKMLLDHMKEPQESPNVALVSCPDYTWNDDNSFLKNRIFDRPIMLKSPKGSGDVFSQFNKVIYIKSPEIWDAHPRLMHEAVYFGREVEYINETEIKDGSYYRYQDLQLRGLNDRLFTEEDRVVRMFK